MSFFNTEFGKALITFILSMVPIIECRGAIPTGVAYGLSTPLVFFLAAIGNFIPVPFIILFIKRIFGWLRKKSERFERLILKLEKRADNKADLIRKYSILGLIIFVGIPLPGTGAWTGALIAALLGIRLKYAVPAIALGIIIACILITVLSLGTKVVINIF